MHKFKIVSPSDYQKYFMDCDPQTDTL